MIVIRFYAAVVKEQELTFAVVVVTYSAVVNNSAINQAQQSFQQHFPGMPIVLCHQDSSRRPTYYGRDNIVKFLASISMEQIPWRTYNV